MERTGAIGVEQMTDKKPKFPKCVLGIALFLLFGCVSSKNCFTEDAYKAMEKYPAMDGSTCLLSCQKLADEKNRTVECGCACETCKRNTIKELFWYDPPCFYKIQTPGGDAFGN